MKLHVKNAILLIATLITTTLSLVTSSAPMSNEFKDPSNPYLPRTWMHVMCGNLSKEGFTKDFEALADAGIGGALVFHIDRGIPCAPTKFGSDDFNDILVHAAVEADRVGIEMGLHNSDGWSSSGGPWVTPEQSMKKIVSSVTITEGGTQTISLPALEESYHYSNDIAVLAWPASDAEMLFYSLTPKLLTSDPKTNLSALQANNLDENVKINADSNGNIWLQASYPKAVTIKSIVTEQQSRNGKGVLWTSMDGEHFEKVGDLEQFRISKDHWSFENQYLEGVKAKHFRVVFDSSFKVRRFTLSASAKVQKWQEKNAMVKTGKVSNIDKDFPKKDIINPNSIYVLNRGALDATELKVNLPKGNWLITRYGYTTTAAQNHPASEAGKGLEIDKLDAKAMDFHFDQYVGKIVKKAQALGSDALLYSEIDSYEMGGNNWTQGFDNLFKQRWNYDLIQWLPIVSGHVVESHIATDAVLVDFRDLIANLMTTNYFQRFADLLHQHGMKSYVEPYGFGTLNELQVGGTADKTMGEFWVEQKGFNGTFDAAVSSARIYGKNVVSAEAFTAWSEVNWRGHPYFMKIFGDHAWASGINETMFHRFAHQPNTHVLPGMTMGSVGSHIDRTQTWWHNAGKSWFKYLARGSYLLQQGNPSSDFLVFVGENSPVKTPRWSNIKLPDGVQGDFVNTDVLINRLDVVDGKLVLPEGTSYNALYLHNSQAIRLKTLKRIEELTRKGAIIVGDIPQEPIGYMEKKFNQKEFTTIVDKIWSNKKQATAYGKGYVFPHTNSAEVMAHLTLGADLLINGSGAKYFTHRTTEDGELYFFFNETKEYKTFDLDFRVSGLLPEVWDADTGIVESITIYNDDGKRTLFNLTLEPNGSRFVFFRKTNNKPQYGSSKLQLIETLDVQNKNKSSKTLPLDLHWQVTFDKAWGGPGTIPMAKLQDWTEHKEEGVRHFSGTAIYNSEFTLPKDWLSSGQPVALDLGDVKIAASVTINGKKFQTLWKPPFALEVGSALKAGNNTIQVAVTNVWTNRLIGDEAITKVDGYDTKKPMPQWFIDNEPAPNGDRYTWTAWNFYAKKSEQVLEPSGLYGPIRLIK